MRKLLNVALLLALCAALCFGVSAAGIYVRDDAGLLDAQQAGELAERLAGLSDDYECDFIVHTADSTGGRSVYDYADDYYEAGDYRESALLVLVVMDSRDLNISAYGEAEQMYGKARREYLVEQLLPLLSDGAYLEAFEEFAGRAERIFKLGVGTELPKEPLSAVVYVVALVIGLATAGICTSAMYRKLRSVRAAGDAQYYVRAGSLDVRVAHERFLYRNVTRTPRANEHSSGGRSGGGGGHVSSSGHHSGGKF